MARRWKILLADELDADAERRLEVGAEIVRPDCCDEQCLAAAIADCDGMVARTHVNITRRVLAAGKKLRVVGVAGVGVDRVDLRAAERLGVAILHTPAASSDAVAEFTVGLMLAVQRSMPQLAASYHRGKYAEPRRGTYGRELREMTIGVVGMGRIGARVGRICSAGIGARVIYNDIVDVGPLAFDAAAVDKTTLWAESDIVTMHVPATELTRGMIDAGVFEQMKASATFVNAARGVVVDTDALTEAVLQKKIAAAGLDVVDPEPLPRNHPLFSAENCMLTPHVAARTRGGLRRMFAVADDVLAYLANIED